MKNHLQTGKSDGRRRSASISQIMGTRDDQIGFHQKASPESKNSASAAQLVYSTNTLSKGKRDRRSVNGVSKFFSGQKDEHTQIPNFPPFQTSLLHNRIEAKSVPKDSHGNCQGSKVRKAKTKYPGTAELGFLSLTERRGAWFALSMRLVLAFLLFALPPGTQGATPFRPLFECEVLLGSPVQAFPMRVLVGQDTFGIEIPGLISSDISTITYSLRMILNGLRISEAEFRATFKDKDVLLIGEGYGVLLPALLEIGARAKAVDPIYALEEIDEAHWNLNSIQDRPNVLQNIARFRNFLATHDEYAFPGHSAALPFADGTFDYVISHMVLSNLTQSSPYETKTLLESVRVLRPKGTAFHVFAKAGYINTFRERLEPYGISVLLRGPQLIPEEYDLPPGSRQEGFREVPSYKLTLFRKENFK